MKSRLKFLEEIVFIFIYRMEKFEVRIVDLEFLNWFLKFRLIIVKNNYSFDENYLSLLFWNLKVSDLWKESMIIKILIIYGNEMKIRF